MTVKEIVAEMEYLSMCINMGECYFGQNSDFVTKRCEEYNRLDDELKRICAEQKRKAQAILDEGKAPLTMSLADLLGA